MLYSRYHMTWKQILKEPIAILMQKIEIGLRAIGEQEKKDWMRAVFVGWWEYASIPQDGQKETMKAWYKDMNLLPAAPGTPEEQRQRMLRKAKADAERAVAGLRGIMPNIKYRLPWEPKEE